MIAIEQVYILEVHVRDSNPKIPGYWLPFFHHVYETREAAERDLNAAVDRVVGPVSYCDLRIRAAKIVA